MNTKVIHISKEIHFENAMRSVISFKKFVDFLQNSIHSGLKIKDPYFKWILKKFKRAPELLQSVPIEKLASHKEILELVSTCLLALTADENSLWALSSPLSPEIFYSTDGFFNLMKILDHPSVLNPETDNEDSESEKILEELQYGMVLEKIYKLPYLKKTEWIRKFEDPATGLDKYFQVHIDTRFIELRPIDDMPALDCTRMTPSSVWGEEFNKIRNILPLNRFEARGFSVLTLSDVTAQQAIEEIGKLVINHPGSDKGRFFSELSHCLQTIAGSRLYEFGIVPFLNINDRPALLYENFPYSIIVQACWRNEVSKKEFAVLRNDFAANPRTIVWTAENLGRLSMPKIIEDAFIHAGIHTYMMFPVYHDNKLTGLFEIGTRGNHPMMSEEQLIKIQPAMPLIAQMIQNLISKFTNSIESIIKEKFTSIQPAVQWKFNETAWHYLRDHIMEEKNEPLEDISFNNLYPLYGAVDIRNSTILRNQALEKDYTIQLKILLSAFASVQPSSPQTERILATANNWLQIIREPLTTQQEIRLSDFFTMDVQSEIEILLQSSPATKLVLRSYQESADEKSGRAYENRRLLESSIQQLNAVINNYYEESTVELQEIFPCYFDKFRTDGVEYDIYVGQSIAPKKPFLKDHLQKMKRWQIDAMVKVIRLTSQLNTEMTYPLQTTQLIFVHPQTIDITFRKDERRFDVEGAYNIRYHIIKKRIDKVSVLDSGERLTQPEKIAIVYFDERDVQDYLDHIKELQLQGILSDDLEMVELESLQGVNGLKALRIGVHVNQDKSYAVRNESLQHEI